MIIFSDFDGTLFFRFDEEKTRQNLEALKKWKAAGNKFCITTGRSYRSVMRQMPEIAELCDYYIVDSGSIVLDSNGKVLTGFYFEPDTIAKIEQYAETLPEKPVVFYYSPDYEGIEPMKDNVTKLRLWFRDAELRDTTARQITEMFGAPAFVQEAASTYKVITDQTGFTETIPGSSGKSNAIRFLADLDHIEPSEIITVGDGLNDRGMIEDYSGFVIEGSDLAAAAPELRTTSSIATLVDKTNL